MNDFREDIQGMAKEILENKHEKDAILSKFKDFYDELFREVETAFSTLHRAQAIQSFKSERTNGEEADKLTVRFDSYLCIMIAHKAIAFAPDRSSTPAVPQNHSDWENKKACSVEIYFSGANSPTTSLFWRYLYHSNGMVELTDFHEEFKANDIKGMRASILHLLRVIFLKDICRFRKKEELRCIPINKLDVISSERPIGFHL